MIDERVAAVIPALDEAATIGDVVRGVTDHVDDVVVVDDGSSDQTAAMARAAGAIVVEHGRNRGYERSIEDGFERAVERGATILLTLDADGQHAAADIPTVLAPIRTGTADVVVGRRPDRNRLTEHLFAWYASRRVGVTDPLCGFKAYRSAVYRTVGHFDQHATIGTQLVFEAKKRGYTVTEVNVSLAERVDEPRFGRQLNANLKVAAGLCRLAWFDLTTRRQSG